MSGWGCCHQLDDQCSLLRKECKPGMPGCVLCKKVTFITDVERKAPRKRRAPLRRAPHRRASGAAASPRKRGEAKK